MLILAVFTHYLRINSKDIVMTTSPTVSANPQSILEDVQQVVVKDQYVNLEAPIRLTGSLNVAALLSDMNKAETAPAESSDIVLQIGVDEAGRGPLLGDVVVAAAILPRAWSGEIEDQPLHGTALAILTDSKKLSEKKRDLLYPLIQQQALGYVVAEVPAVVIDQVNILQATMLGMRLCTEQLLDSVLVEIQAAGASATNSDSNKTMNTVDNAKLKVELLFDGNHCPEFDFAKFAALGLHPEQIDLQAWVKGDGRHTSIAAASVLAKVGRDLGMYEMAKKYPQFGIEQHKGYPTKAHLAAIAEHGVLPAHRRSFGPVRRALEG
ncbi:ribonuclease HII [Psychrobacter arenosus]